MKNTNHDNKKERKKERMKARAIYIIRIISHYNIYTPTMDDATDAAAADDDFKFNNIQYYIYL